MLRTLSAVLIALACGVTTTVAQETRPAQAEADKPTHGIIRKARPKTADVKAAEPVKQPPVASTEAAAAAIAAAVRSIEETKAPAPPRPRPARPAELRAPQRRYEVRWPSQRLEVQWATPDERVSLSWQPSDVHPEPPPDERRLEP